MGKYYPILLDPLFEAWFSKHSKYRETLAKAFPKDHEQTIVIAWIMHCYDNNQWTGFDDKYAAGLRTDLDCSRRMASWPQERHDADHKAIAQSLSSLAERGFFEIKVGDEITYYPTQKLIAALSTKA
jgi:hypothetical protein